MIAARLPWLACLPLLVVAGCARPPFDEPARPILVHPDPQAIRQRFAQQLPQRFVSEDTVIIDALFDNLAALGVVQVDRQARTFKLLCLNHLGVQLFLLSGDSRETRIDFAVPPLQDRRQVLLAVAEDIRRIYFDVAPGPDASVTVGRRWVRFREERDGQIIEYEFGGDPVALLEKRCPGFVEAVWRVRYYAYDSAQDRLFPRGVVLDNHRYRYRIVVKNRSWEAQ